MAEERVVLAGVSDRAAVAGQTHKHIVNVCLTPSRNRPVSASPQCVWQQDNDSSTWGSIGEFVAKLVAVGSTYLFRNKTECSSRCNQCHFKVVLVCGVVANKRGDARQ